MKLRRVGNSLGTSFTSEVLSKANFKAGDELEVSASAGEIRLHKKDAVHIIELTEEEAQALAEMKPETKAAGTAIARVRSLLAEKC